MNITAAHSARAAWRVQARRWTLAVGALCGVAFAPSAQAIATYSALTDFSVSATTQSPGVTVSATATLVRLEANGTGTGSAIASSGVTPGSGIPVDLLTGTLEVTAQVFGSAVAPGTSEAFSWHDVEIFLANPGSAGAEVVLSFRFQQVGSASTTAPGESALALSAVEFDDFLNLAADGFPLSIIASLLRTDEVGDFDTGELTVDYTVLVPAGETGEISGVIGAVDAQGSAVARVVPEPTTGLLLLAGLAGLGYARRRARA
jgi:hypothetical protein